MAFRNEDQNFPWAHPAPRHEQWPQRGVSTEPEETKLSLHDTLRELGVTIFGFVGAIILIVAAVSALRG